MSVLTITKDKKQVSTAVVVAALQKKAAPMFNKLKRFDKVKSQEDFDEVGEQIKMLKEIKGLANEEESNLTAEIRESIDKLKVSIVKIDAFFQPFRDKVDETEADYKKKMLDWVNSLDKKLEDVNQKFEAGKLSVAQYAKQTAGLQVKNGAAKAKGLKRLEIFDDKKIPREYLMPNENAIKAALNNGTKVPGCRMVKTNSIAI